jgi:hypothetical protein
MLLSVRKQPRLVRALARDSSWHLAYADDESRYYTKSTERASGVSR